MANHAEVDYVLQECISLSAMSNSLWPHGHSLPGSSVHGILQIRILKWVAILFSRGSSRPRGPCAVQTHVIQGSAALSSHSGQALGWVLWRETVERRMLLLKTPIELVWVGSFPLLRDSGTICHTGRDQWLLL